MSSPGRLFYVDPSQKAEAVTDVVKYVTAVDESLWALVRLTTGRMAATPLSRLLIDGADLAGPA